MNKIIIESENKRIGYIVDSSSIIEKINVSKINTFGIEDVSFPDFESHRIHIDGKPLKEITISEVVWQNECCLVFCQDDYGTIGKMGLCFTDKETGEFSEVQVSVREFLTNSLMKKLRGQSVRITIEVVPEGNR